MFRLAFTSIRARKARLVLTAMAVVLGVAFMAGTLVLTDTLRHAYDGIAATELASTDAVVQSAATVDQGMRGTTRGTLPASVVDTVRGVDGVAAADGVFDATARLVRRDGTLVDNGIDQATPIGMAWPSTDALNPLRLVSGHAPQTDDEVVIDRASARDGGYTAGDTVRVLTPAGTATYTVAGVATYGTEDDAGGAGVVAFTPAMAARVLAAPGRVDSVHVLAAPGVAPANLVHRIRAALGTTTEPGGIEVVTGRAAAAAAEDEAHRGMAFVSTFLMVFAIVALVVGGFVIFNAFSITVAQRTTEMAMLRAIGASRRQVKRAVVVEAAIVGVVAAAAGAVVGIGLAAGLASLLRAFGVELPGGALVVSPRSIGTAVLLGTVVTVLAAWLPARRAGRIAPLAAVRSVAVDRSSASRFRLVAGALLTLVGGVALAQGAGVAALAVFAGVIMLGPVIARAFVRTVGAPIGLVGVTGVLARENAARNPKRTAATASALMIGAALVVLISVFAASARASIDHNVDRGLYSDWVITPLQVQDGLSPSVATELAALPEIGSVTTWRYAPATLEGGTVEITGIDPSNLERHVDIDVRAGSVQALGTDGIGVNQTVATSHGWHVGDEVTLTFPETGTRRFTIALVYGLHDPLGGYVLSQQAFDANVAHLHDQGMFVADAPGVSHAQARAAMERVLAATPSARLHSPGEFKAFVAGRIDKLLNLIYVLLLLAVLIALFGIANTMALAVVERRREIGLLRAVGMHRAQVRASIRREALLVALLGLTLGTALGLAFAWAIVRALADQGIGQLAIPGGRLVVVVALGAGAALLAAALPARRAARVDVLRAIQA